VDGIETLAEERGQALAVGVILVASLTAAIAGVSGTQTAVLIAAVMLCVLGAATLSMRNRMRTHALELIIEGREDVPVAAVEDERRRLLAPRGRRLLAGSLTRGESVGDRSTGTYKAARTCSSSF
jgi:hypothetical protein